MRRLLSLSVAGAIAMSWGDAAAVPVAAAQVQVEESAASVPRLLTEIEHVLLGGDPAAYIQLLHESADRSLASAFSVDEVRPGATRTVIRERARQAFDGPSPPGGQRLLVDAFTEFGNRARVASWQIDARPSDGSDWRIAGQRSLTAIDDLYRLSLDTSRRFRAVNFTVTAPDLELTLVDGHVYFVTAQDRVAGLILIGDGEMRFSPASATERRQVEIFAGAETLTSGFNTAYVRAADIDTHVTRSTLDEVTVDRREMEEAQEVFAAESVKAYVLDLGDLTPDTWSTLLPFGDFLVEVDTRRFDTLTYARNGAEPEDIVMFDRRRQRTISSYRSAQRIEAEGPFFSEEAQAQYDVLDYNVNTVYTPDGHWLDGRTRMRVRARGTIAGQMSVRLADALEVRSIDSDEFGPLFGLRASDQNLVLVSLPASVLPGTEFSLTLVYAGRLAPQSADRETLITAAAQNSDAPQAQGEPNFLYSSRSYWYAQSPVGGYATARLRISVPAQFTVVATGAPSEGSPWLLSPDDGTEGLLYEFTTQRPVRYLAFAASRFVTVDRVTLPVTAEQSLNLTITANPLQRSSARAMLTSAAEIFRFYHSIVGDMPYEEFTLALVESPQPGGHSPAYFALLNQPLPNTPWGYRPDPVSFRSFPELILAHEIAHQWWGHGVGWQNYHEQWLSEGIAQYFAAMYASRARGARVFGDVLRQMRESAIDDSAEGPVYLGYRLGHVRRDSRIFRALVYNKGAVVLHMLRRLMGDAAFFQGLQRFYDESRYRRVGTEDLRSAMERESGRSFERFFEQWIYGASIPQLTYAHQEFRGLAREVAIRVVQAGEPFEFPVTMTLEFTDRSTRDIVIPVSDAVTEVRIPIDAPLRALRMNERDGTLANARRVTY